MRTSTAVPTNPRLQAFCDPQSPEVFHSIAHWEEVWQEDPFDVEEIHQEARDRFASLLNRATTEAGTPSGRILLLLGEAGSGKTHLMRAFRHSTHSKRLGYFGYMQLSSPAGNYGQYILGNLIESLHKPYSYRDGTGNGLMRLSQALADHACLRAVAAPLAGKSVPALQALREEECSDNELGRLVYLLAEALLRVPQFQAIDMDLLRALLFLQRGDTTLNSLVIKYLRCEDLDRYQRERLGDLTPKIRESDASRTVEMLGRLMRAAHGASLVLCLDQLEGIFNLDDARQRFQRAMSAVCQIVDQVPSSLIVISCLQDYYVALRKDLNQAVLDRLERDVAPMRLEGLLSMHEIELLVEYRLRHLYEKMETPFDESNPTYPFTREALHSLVKMHSRNALIRCGQYQQKAIQLGRFPSAEEMPGEAGTLSVIETPSVINLEQEWSTWKATRPGFSPLSPVEIANVLAQTLAIASGELDGALLSPNVQDTRIFLDGWSEKLLIGLCEKNARGGGLQKEIEALCAHAGGCRLVIARTSEFPKSPTAQVVKLVGQLIAQGARRVVIEDADLRAMVFFQQFQKQHGHRPGFNEWLTSEKPLTRLPSIQMMLDLEHHAPPAASVLPALVPEAPAEPAVSETPEREPLPALNAERPGALVIGSTLQIIPRPVTVEPEELTSHAAFLGGTGSGKTTLALSVIERLLLRGYPAVLVDRKGDLCRYADPSAWTSESPEEASRLRELQGRVEVSLYTPGSPRGRALAIPLLPDEVEDLPSLEREQIAQYASTALCRMMDYQFKTSQQKSQQAILKTALALLVDLKASGHLPRIELPTVIAFLAEKDDALIHAVGRLDIKLFDKLVSDLETLRLTKAGLLSAEDERLDAAGLFGKRPSGRTPLSIISTKFLSSLQDIEFWVSQFLVELGRWTGRHPSPRLQGIVLFDEADLYLPATRKPATKDPMENLLKRARSAGLGIFLATQSPGDLDYKCRDNIRTWFLGRIQEETALKKLKPMLQEYRVDGETMLPGQSPGQFVAARDGRVERFKADRCRMAPRQMPEDRILELAAKIRQA